MAPPWASDAAWGQSVPGRGMPPGVRLWLPVAISFLLQVPAVLFQLWRGRGQSEQGRSEQGWFQQDWSEQGWSGFDWSGTGILVLALAIAGPLTLIAARRHPGPVAAVNALLIAIVLLVQPDIGFPYAAAAFAIVLGIVRGARIWVYASVAGAWVATVALASLYGVFYHPLRVALTTLGLVILMGIGETLRRRSDRIQEARRAMDQRRMSAEQRERVRIARELHDVLAHSLSQINVQAGVGLHLIESQPDKAAEALASIKSTSKNALQEVRMVLGILRSDTSDSTDGRGSGEPPLMPEPDLAGLPALIESFRAQGLSIDDVNALHAEAAVPAATQLALYRICQEALTNVLRHAQAATASVYLGVDRGSYLLTVTDDGLPSAGHGEFVPGGGLLGMRERAELLGGSVRFTRSDEHGFRVDARLPLRPATR